MDRAGGGKDRQRRAEDRQLEAYLDIAREQGFDALVTISNEITPVPRSHPATIESRKLRKVALYHLPWTEILTPTVIQRSIAASLIRIRRGSWAS